MTHDEKTLKRAEELGDLADLAGAAARAALLRTLQGARDGTLKDDSAAARNAAVVAGIATEKRNLLLDRPTSIAAPSTDLVADGLRLLGKYGLTVDATATEIPAPALPPAPEPEPEPHARQKAARNVRPRAS